MERTDNKCRPECLITLKCGNFQAKANEEHPQLKDNRDSGSPAVIFATVWLRDCTDKQGALALGLCGWLQEVLIIHSEIINITCMEAENRFKDKD